jgi:hypothetical protein
MAVALVVIAVVVVGGFVALVSMRYRQEQSRQAGWAAEAARLGLRHAQGDPLGLAERLQVNEVSETVSGTVDGVRVAAVTVSKIRGFQQGRAVDERQWFTWSMGVALDSDVVVDRRPAGAHLTEAPLPASELEGLLRETAARAS